MLSTHEAYRQLILRWKWTRRRWLRFAETPRGKRWLRGVRILFTVGIFAYLAYQLTSIGWERIWTALPRTPWFYVIFGGMYLTLPIFQALIYGLIWGLPPWKLFSATLKKRIYNKDVLSYSGEVYLYFWARRRVALPDRQILHTIKDNAIVSSATSTVVAVGLLVVFFVSGLMRVPSFMVGHEAAYIGAALLAGAVLVALGIRFRRALLMLPGRVLLMLAGLHLGRLLVVQGLQVLQWNVVIPEVPLEIWFTFLAAQIITSRIPLLPSRDLIWVGAGIELARAVHVPEAAVAGMLLVHSMLDKALNFLLFAAVSMIDRRSQEGLREAERAATRAAAAPRGSAEAVSVEEKVDT